MIDYIVTTAEGVIFEQDTVSTSSLTLEMILNKLDEAKTAYPDSTPLFSIQKTSHVLEQPEEPHPVEAEIDQPLEAATAQ